MGKGLGILVAGIILLLLDWYFYQSIKTILVNSSTFKKNLVFYIYWGFTAFSLLLFLTPTIFTFNDFPKFIRIYVFAFVVMVIISKLIGTTFIIIDDIIRLFRWIASYFTKAPEVITNEVAVNPHAISRLKFLNYVAVGMAALPFASFIYGMVKGAFDYKVHNVKVTYQKHALEILAGIAT